MTYADQKAFSLPVAKAGSRIASIAGASLPLLGGAGTLAAIREPSDEAAVTFLVLALCLLAVFHARFLILARAAHREARRHLAIRNWEFHSIFDGAQETVLVVDDSAVCRDANPAASRIFDMPRTRLVGSTIADLCFSPEDFERCWVRLRSGESRREQLRLMRPDHTSRVVELTARVNFLAGRHMIFFRDIPERRENCEATVREVGLADSAWMEAQALRRATRVLTQDLRLDAVLDVLLEILRSLVPYELAQVMLLEEDSRLFLAREAIRFHAGYAPTARLHTTDLREQPLLRQVLATPEGILLHDAEQERRWRPLRDAFPIRSWLGVPLRSSGRVVGLLSVVHSNPAAFNAEHLRLARSIADPVAAAVENARLYERAEIYRAELERHLADQTGSEVDNG